MYPGYQPAGQDGHPRLERFKGENTFASTPWYLVEKSLLIQKLASQIGRETGLLPRPGPHKRDASLRPLSEVELYFEWKNVLGSRSETLSLRQFVIKNQDVIWDRPEESLQYPGMIIHYDHHKRFNLGLRFWLSGSYFDRRPTIKADQEGKFKKSSYPAATRLICYLLFASPLLSSQKCGSWFQFKAASTSLSTLR